MTKTKIEQATIVEETYDYLVVSVRGYRVRLNTYSRPRDLRVGLVETTDRWRGPRGVISGIEVIVDGDAPCTYYDGAEYVERRRIHGKARAIGPDHSRRHDDGWVPFAAWWGEG
jgi:hypothetical protein